MNRRGRWGRALLLDGAILSLWFASVGFVLWYEGGPLWGGRVPLATLLDASVDAKEQWFGIYYRDQKIGFAHSTVTPNELEGMPGVSVTDRGQLFFTLLGTPQQLELSAKAFIDADWRLRTFEISLHAEAYSLRWVGRRRGDTLIVQIQTGATTTTQTIHDATGQATVSGLSSWLAFHRLSVGQQGQVWVLNPLSLTPEPVTFHVLRQETLNGQTALVVDAELHGVVTTSWVTPEGDVLKEESPLGWLLLQEPMQEAVMVPSRTAVTLDLLSTVAVPLDRPIEDPTRLSRLTLLVEGITASAMPSDRPWQRARATADGLSLQRPAPTGPWCVVELRQPTVPRDRTTGTDAVQATRPSIPSRYLRASPFIQSDDPRILDRAREIVGNRTDVWERVTALHQWVYTTLRKRLTVGLPSAVDVLLDPSGDCHEHTVVFTALARSLGIPTRATAGLVYYEGRLYYHAWPEVWVGEWVPTDPTLGQLVADPTHLALVEAENEQLVTLTKFLGQLQIRVLEAARRHD